MKNIANKPYDEREWIYRQSDDKKNRFLLGKRGEKSKEGHPHHPLYLSQKCNLEVFDVHIYLEGLK